MFKCIGVLLLAVIIYAFFWNSASDSRFQACRLRLKRTSDRRPPVNADELCRGCAQLIFCDVSRMTLSSQVYHPGLVLP